VSVFFTENLNTHSENQVTVREGFSFSDIVNRIMKMKNEQNLLLLSEKVKKKLKMQTDDVNAE